MDNMSYPPNTPQYPQQPPPYAVQTGGHPTGQPVGHPAGQPTKSGCGCCGCLFGCLAVLLIPPLILLILYFTVDVGKFGDQAMVWTYYNVVRPRVIEPAMKNTTDTQKQQALAVMDHYVEAYQKLPDAERKLIRQEAMTYLYYESQNQKAPPEKVQHLNQFIQSQIQILQQKYPQGVPSINPPSTSPSAPPTAPPPSLPLTPRAPPPTPAERPTPPFLNFLFSPLGRGGVRVG